MPIAGALNVDVDLLRFDWMAFLAREFGVSKEQLTPELMAEKRREIAANHVALTLTRVESSANLQSVSDADAMRLDCASHDDEVRDRVAELQEQLMDLMDIGGKIHATGRRELEKHAFEVVRQLHRLRNVVSLVLHHHELKPATGDPMQWSKNGVHVDGVRVPSSLLVPGAEIRIGTITVIVESPKLIALRTLLERLIGWGEDRREDVDQTLFSIRIATMDREPLLLRGTGNLVPIARMLHQHERISHSSS